MPHQSYDADAREHRLPVRSDSPGTRRKPADETTPPRQLSSFIDLTGSPDPEPRIPIQDEAHTKRQQKQRTEAQISADRKRLVGDFERPRDATMLPSPGSLHTKFAAQSLSAMRAKPGSTTSFKPLNTIDRVNPGPHIKRSGNDCSIQAPVGIGRSPGPGQQAYLESKRSSPRTGSVSGGRPPTRHGRTEQITPPSKRRKILHIVDDNDEAEEQNSRRTPDVRSPHLVSRHFATPTPRSHVEWSTSSVHTGTSRNPTTQTTSEFDLTNQLYNPTKKKAKTFSKVYRHAHSLQPTSRSGRNGPAEKSAEPEDNNVKVQRSSCRASTDDNNLEDSVSSDKNKGSILDFFHVRGSQRKPSDQPGELESTNGTRSRGNHESSPANDMSTSEDELARDPMQSKLTKHGRQRSLRQSRTSPKTQSKHGESVVLASKIYPLQFARTNDAVYFRNSGEENKSDLILQVEPKTWHVRAYNAGANSPTRGFDIHAEILIKAFCDKDTQIRMESSRSKGMIRVFDLQFVNKADLMELEVIASNWVQPGTVHTRSPDVMRAMFGKPVDHGKPSEPVHPNDRGTEYSLPMQESQGARSKTFLWTGMKVDYAKAENADILEASDNKMTSVPPSRTSTRVTRATKRGHVQNDEDRPESLGSKTEKYSVVHGLGPRWRGFLRYGEGKNTTLLKFEDLERLDEGEFLNDDLIAFYLNHLFEKWKVPCDKVLLFNTYFHHNILSDVPKGKHINYDKVQRWTKNVDIFGYDYIVVPVNLETHWYVAVVCNVSKINRTPLGDDSNDADKLGTLVSSSSRIRSADDGLPCKRIAVPSSNASMIVEDRNASQSDSVNLFEEEAQQDLPLNTVTRTLDNQDHSKLDEVAPFSQTPAIELAHTGALHPENLNVGELSASTVPLPRKKGPKRRTISHKRNPDEPVIVILDSLGCTRAQTVRALKYWLAEEGKAKRGMEVVIDQPGYYTKGYQIPMQDNFTDCGVYLLGYVEKFFRNPDAFKKCLLSGQMTTEDDWSDFDPNTLRHEMRRVVLKLADEQGLTRKADKRSKCGAQGKGEKQIASPLNAVEQPVLVTAHDPPTKNSQTDDHTEIQGKSSQQSSCPPAVIRTSPEVRIISNADLTHPQLPMRSNAERADNLNDLQEPMGTSSVGVISPAAQERARSQSVNKIRNESEFIRKSKRSHGVVESVSPTTLRQAKEATQLALAGRPRGGGTSSEPIEIADSQGSEQQQNQTSGAPLASRPSPRNRRDISGPNEQNEKSDTVHANTLRRQRIVKTDGLTEQESNHHLSEQLTKAAKTIQKESISASDVDWSEPESLEAEDIEMRDASIERRIQQSHKLDDMDELAPDYESRRCDMMDVNIPRKMESALNMVVRETPEPCGTSSGSEQGAGWQDGEPLLI